MKTISLGIFFALAGSCAAFETNRPVSVSPFIRADFGSLTQPAPLVALPTPGGMAGLGKAFQAPARPSVDGPRPASGGVQYPMLMGDANPMVDWRMVHRADQEIDTAMIHSPDPERRGLTKVARPLGRFWGPSRR